MSGLDRNSRDTLDQLADSAFNKYQHDEAGLRQWLQKEQDHFRNNPEKYQYLLERLAYESGVGNDQKDPEDIRISLEKENGKVTAVEIGTPGMIVRKTGATNAADILYNWNRYPDLAPKQPSLERPPQGERNELFETGLGYLQRGDHNSFNRWLQGQRNEHDDGTWTQYLADLKKYMEKRGYKVEYELYSYLALGGGKMTVTPPGGSPHEYTWQ